LLPAPKAKKPDLLAGLMPANSLLPETDLPRDTFARRPPVADPPTRWSGVEFLARRPDLPPIFRSLSSGFLSSRLACCVGAFASWLRCAPRSVHISVFFELVRVWGFCWTPAAEAVAGRISCYRQLCCSCAAPPFALPPLCSTVGSRILPSLGVAGPFRSRRRRFAASSLSGADSVLSEGLCAALGCPRWLFW